MNFHHKSDSTPSSSRLLRLRLLVAAPVVALIIGCHGRILVNGLSCPVCMHPQNASTLTQFSCPLQPCGSEQDFRASSAALLKDFGSVLAKHLVDQPSDSGLTTRSGGRGGAASTSTQGPFYCFKVTGSVAVPWLGVNLNQVEDVVASGCSMPIDGKAYDPQDGPHHTSGGWARVTAGFAFTGELYTCDESMPTSIGPTCGEGSAPSPSGVGPSAPAAEPTIIEPGPELHCASCLYQTPNSNTCTTVKCDSEEDYFKSSGIVFTDYMKLVSESFRKRGGGGDWQADRRKREAARNSSAGTTGVRVRRNVQPEPFYCYSFTGKVSDTMGFDGLSGLKDTEVVARGCSRPDEDHDVKFYEPSLKPHVELTFKTAAFLSFEGEGYTCNKTIGIGPNCSPVTKANVKPTTTGPGTAAGQPSSDTGTGANTNSTSAKDPYAVCDEDIGNGAKPTIGSNWLLAPGISILYSCTQ